MFRKKLGVMAVAAGVAFGLSTGTVLAASSGSNSGSSPDLGNCLGNFVNQGHQGFEVSNLGPPEPSDLGQFVGKESRGCRD
jgi:hypothetical protein